MEERVATMCIIIQINKIIFSHKASDISQQYALLTIINIIFWIMY